MSKDLLKRLLSITILSFHAALKNTGFSRITSKDSISTLNFDIICKEGSDIKLSNEHTEFVKIDWNNRTQEVLNYCFQKGISSLIIEGGTQTIEQFMQTNAWDEARLFINPNQTFGNGIKAPLINLDNKIPVTVGKDWLYTLQNT